MVYCDNRFRFLLGCSMYNWFFVLSFLIPVVVVVLDTGAQVYTPSKVSRDFGVGALKSSSRKWERGHRMIYHKKKKRSKKIAKK